MKVKCIDDTGMGINLTEGKTYDLMYEQSNCSYVMDDKDNKFGYYSKRFVQALADNQHVHAALIHLWADGAIIQHYFVGSGRWADTCDNNPSWLPGEQYRVKPDEVVELERKIQAAQTGIDVAHNLLEDLTEQLEKANA